MAELPQVFRFVALEGVVFGEREGAVRIAQESVEIDPQDAERHRALGDVYLEPERYTEAAGAYRRVFDVALLTGSNFGNGPGTGGLAPGQSATFTTTGDLSGMSARHDFMYFGRNFFQSSSPHAE